MPHTHTDAATSAAAMIRVMIVDDNKGYRNAFRRNLAMRNYQVCEAENADEALAVLKTERPHVLITDLQMRGHDEGLDLIRRVKAIDPLLPVILISAVGTFEEGAEATRLGAIAVIHKSRIEEEIERMYHLINNAYEAYRRNALAMEQVQEIRARDAKTLAPQDYERLQKISAGPEYNETVRSEAFDALQGLTQEEIKRATHETVRRVMGEDQAQAVLRNIEEIINSELPSFDRLEGDSKESLRNAEFLYQQQTILGTNIDFSRNIGFSYCFGVENEAKSRLRKRQTRFLSSQTTPQLVAQMLDSKKKALNLFFHQALFRAQKGHKLEITFDNVVQVLQRVEQHGPRYKPDGLKALGIMILCFGREYEFIDNHGERVLMQNPLGLKGLEEEEEVITFCELLIGLQHYRNPYIHPEINDMAKLSKIRDTSYQCLRMIAKIG
ncbi:MAG: response regulator [Candidatus Sumerlaeota bacterium]|nr:response regulator [Candidatus Sumerlaeota bacterium]